MGVKNTFIDKEDKKIYKYFREIEGKSEILMGNLRYGLCNYVRYTILLWL